MRGDVVADYVRSNNSADLLPLMVLRVQLIYSYAREKTTRCKMFIEFVGTLKINPNINL